MQGTLATKLAYRQSLLHMFKLQRALLTSLDYVVSDECAMRTVLLCLLFLWVCLHHVDDVAHNAPEAGFTAGLHELLSIICAFIAFDLAQCSLSMPSFTIKCTAHDTVHT